MPAPVLQFKRGNAGVAGTVPALRPGEPAISLNNYDFFIGIDTSVANNKFFGSHRYWGREDGTNSLKLKLVDKNGSNYVAIKSPDTLAGNVTYQLPGTQGGNGTVLTNDGSGNLTWGSGTSNAVFTGVSTFSDTTDNTLGDPDTGAVQIDGGLGVNKNVTVGQGLYVSDTSSFNGISTFNDQATFNSVIQPSVGNMYAGIIWPSDPGGGSGDTAYIKYYVESGENTRLEISNQNDADDDIYLSTPEVNVSDTLKVLGTTDNTLGDVNSGAVQIDGGVGIEKNLSVGAGLSVAGQSYFVGDATFYGGTLNLGDSNGDDINVAGEFISNLVPNATNTYDLGLTGKRWRNGFYSGNVDITGNLVVDGNVTVGGGTTVILYGQDVFIKNKDIILGYTTSVTNQDASTDDTANHAGVAIASTVGSPLVSFSASGINTLPDTYKQMMWFHSGTLGFGTDAFAFNYGVAIGTTNMANGVRLAVGSGVTVSDTSVSATNFYGALTGSITGNAASADQVKTVDTGNNNANYYITFVNSNNGSATNETVYTDDAIYYNPGTNTFITQYGHFTGDVTVDGTINAGSITGTATTATRATTVDTTSTGTNTNYHLVFTDNATSTTGATMRVDAGIYYNPSSNYLFSSLFVGDVAASTIKAADVTTAMTLANSTGNVTFNNNITVPGTITGTATTATRATLVDTTGTSNNATYYATFVDTSGGQTSETLRTGTALSLNASTGNVKSAGDLITGSGYLASSNGTRGLYIYDTTAEVSFQGKAVVNEIRSATNASTLITLSGLDATFANNVNITGITTVGSNLFVGGDVQINGNDIKASDGNTNITLTSNTLTTFAGDIKVAGNDIQASDGNTNITMTSNTLTEVKGDLQITGNDIKSSTGAVAITLSANDVQITDDLTVGGNLYVNGNTTQVNTSSITVEDRTIELGVVDGSAPSSTTTWDLGVLFNYYDGSAKKSAVVWEQSASRFKLGSVISDGGGTGDNNPQITFTSYAALEISDLWINNSCTGGSAQVIGCVGSELQLQNITVDAGVF